MGGSVVTGLRQVAVEQDTVRARANFRNRRDSSTLVLDQFGRILSCDASAEHVFGARAAGMLGHRISDFVKGLFLTGSSPSFGERYLVHLCAGGDWRRFEARDSKGQAFPVEISLARMASNSPERAMYLLDVRRAVPARAS